MSKATVLLETGNSRKSRSYDLKRPETHVRYVHGARLSAPPSESRPLRFQIECPKCQSLSADALKRPG